MLVIIPIFVTLLLTGFLYVKLTTWAVRFFARLDPAFASGFWPEQMIRLLALFCIILLLLLVGEFASYKIGRWLIRFAEWIMMKLPLLSSIYATCRQIGEALWTPEGSMFSKVVLIEYPRKGVWAIGFLTNENKDGWEVNDKTGNKLISIFLPTTPNPTSGFLLLIPKEECIVLDMDVADGMRLVISGGAVNTQGHKYSISPFANETQ